MNLRIHQLLTVVNFGRLRLSWFALRSGKMTSILSRTLLKQCLKRVIAKPVQTNIRLASYKAAVLKEIGKPLDIEEKKASSLKKTQVRINVHYCSVNSVDVGHFSETDKDLPFVPGYELSGEVVEVGKNVTPEQVIVGERVAALSLEKFGGFAEECIVNIYF